MAVRSDSDWSFFSRPFMSRLGVLDATFFQTPEQSERKESLPSRSPAREGGQLLLARRFCLEGNGKR